MPGAARAAGRAAAAGVAAAAGEDPGGDGPEAAAGEGGAAGAGPAGRDVPGPVREIGRVRQPEEREDAHVMCDLAGIDPFGTTGLFPGLRADGSGPAGGQAGVAHYPGIDLALA